MVMQKIARLLSHTPPMQRGRQIWEKNQVNWDLPLTRWDKLFCGLYIILDDYSNGIFPPTFNDQQKAYDAEINYMFALPGIDPQAAIQSQMRKPFWFGRAGRDFLGDFIKLMRVLEKTRLAPPLRLLELGCGTGWMAEFLALMKYDLVATSISHHEILEASKRVPALTQKGIQVQLQYIASPMEDVEQAVCGDGCFDVVFAYEALHHAYDWRKAVQAAYRCLKPGGWLLLCNEPNQLHTFVSYRVAKLTATHEIGFKRSDLHSELARAGFRKITHPLNKMDLIFNPFWIAAQK